MPIYIFLLKFQCFHESCSKFFFTSNLSHDFSMENIVISSSICFYHMKTTTAAGTGAVHCRLKDPKYRIWARRAYDNGLGFINFSINYVDKHIEIENSVHKMNMLFTFSNKLLDNGV